MDKLPTTPSFMLNGRRALVTGGGRGIGMGAAIALAEAGAQVDLVARTARDVHVLADAIRYGGGWAAGYPLDVTDKQATDDFIAANGPYQILVNNAGANRPANLLDVTEEDYDAVAALNIRAAIFVARAVARGMIAKKLKGSIINLGSQMGHVSGPRRTVYSATKHAVEGMTKAMAWELGPHNIRVNTVCPTFVETDMTAPMLEDEQFLTDTVARIALGRVAQVQDIMGAFVYLASDASAMVTGSSLKVDGGWTAA